jgi:acyl-CoA thioester hydrolase
MEVHRWPIRVYFEDTDAGGIVYHANYLRWAERARTESLRAMNLPHQLMILRYASMLVVRRIEVEYVAPARLDDSLIVETRVLAVRGASVDLDQQVRDETGAVRAVLTVGLVCVKVGDDATGMRPAPIPGPWRDALRAGINSAL